MEQTPLGRLPGELRNEIYSYVLHEPQSIRLCLVRGQLTYWAPGSEDKERFVNVVRLFGVCRAMRAEARGYYATNNHITIHSESHKKSPPEALVQWSQVFGDHALLHEPRSVTFYHGSLYYKGVPMWKDVQCAMRLFHSSVPVYMAIGVGPVEKNFDFASSTHAITFLFGRQQEALQKLDDWELQYIEEVAILKPKDKETLGIMLVIRALRAWISGMPSSRTG